MAVPYLFRGSLMLFAGYRPTTGNFPSELMAVTAARLGWRVLSESRLVASTSPDQTGFLATWWGGRTVLCRGRAHGNALPAGKFTRDWSALS